MKNVFFALAAFFAVTAPAAQAAIIPDMQYTVVMCRDANFNLADAGTSVVIKSGGFAGMTLAQVSEESFAGPVEVGTVVVHSVPQTHSTAPVVYAGDDFTLTIRTHAGSIHDYYFPALLKAEIKGASYNKKLACQFVPQPL